MSVAAFTIARALADARRDNARLRAAIEAAVREIEGGHYPDAFVDWCATCGSADGHWPCVTRMVADDLRASLS